MGKKDLIILFGAICAAILLALTQFLSDTVTAGAWGLSFRQPGQTPFGTAGSDVLKKYNIGSGIGYCRTTGFGNYSHIVPLLHGF